MKDTFLTLWRVKSGVIYSIGITVAIGLLFIINLPEGTPPECITEAFLIVVAAVLPLMGVASILTFFERRIWSKLMDEATAAGRGGDMSKLDELEEVINKM